MEREHGSDGLQDVDHAVEKALAEAQADLNVPELRPQHLKQALRKAEEASVVQQWQASVKARVLARIQQRFAESNTRTIRSQKELVQAKGELLEETHELVFKVQDLNQKREISELDHAIERTEREIQLAELQNQLDRINQGPETVEAEPVDEEEKIREEVEEDIGRHMKREVFTQRFKSETMEELIREKHNRLAEIDDLDLPESEKEQLRGELERGFHYAIKRVVSGV